VEISPFAREFVPFQAGEINEEREPVNSYFRR